MKLLIISDLHYDNKIFRGVDESRAWGWLLSIVDYQKPDLLLSCGDWGSAVNPREFYDLLKRTVVMSIYGNHENMDVLEMLYNIKSKEYLPVLMQDGKIYEIGGLRIAGINGIIAKERKTKKGVPRKTPEEFIAIAERLKNQNLDILLMHETPYLPQLFPVMKEQRERIGAATASKAIEIVKPRIVINGHMHLGGYKTHTFPWGTLYIYISSDQRERHYLILDAEDKRIEVWRDLEAIDTIDAGKLLPSASKDQETKKTR